MSDEHDNDDSLDLTMQVSGDELSKLRQSSQLRAFTHDEVDRLTQVEDDSTKAINRENLVEIIKSEIRESSDSPEQQGFGIIKRTKSAKLKPTPKPKTEFPKPQLELDSMNSDTTMTVNAEMLKSLRAGEDLMESTLDVPLQGDAVEAMFDALDEGDKTLVGSYNEMIAHAISGAPVEPARDVEDVRAFSAPPKTMPKTECANHLSVPMDDDVLPRDVSGELDRAAVIAAVEAQNSALNNAQDHVAVAEIPTETETQPANTAPTPHQSEEVNSIDDAGEGKLSLIFMGLVLLVVVVAVALKLSGLLGV